MADPGTRFLGRGKPGRREQPAHVSLSSRATLVEVPLTGLSFFKGLDLDLWCGPAPLAVPVRRKFHYDWHWTHRTGNGDIGNQNPHELDKAR